VLLIGAQQSAGDVDGNITHNAAVKVVGRTFDNFIRGLEHL
jgi:hypothetical protein